MKKQKTKKVVRKKKISFINILFIFVTIYFISTFINQQELMNKYNSQIEMYKIDIASKEKLSKYYNDKESNVETDEYIEQVARESLGLVKPYEKIFIDVNK
ncbi:MAG: septum formation initiator family protein [Clostridia bacterium]